MLTVRDAAQALGTTERGVRLRLDALRPEITAMLRRGRNGSVILTDSAWALLRRMEDVRQADALTVNLAAERVRREFAEQVTGEGQATPTHGNGNGGEAAALRELVETLRTENERLARENERLWQLVNEQLPKLPGPKERNPWWWPLRRFVFGGP
ncbi:MAG: hypothetical protein WAW99_04125 [Candidatus Bipolaricaulis anaerobius]